MNGLLVKINSLLYLALTLVQPGYYDYIKFSRVFVGTWVGAFTSKIGVYHKCTENAAKSEDSAAFLHI